MPLPIPDILQRAAILITAARALKSSQTSENILAVGSALDAVNEDDLLAVMNEVGKVYMGVHNPQVTQIGARGNTGSKNLEIAIHVDFGLGPRIIVVPLPHENAVGFISACNEAMRELRPGGIINTLDA